MTEREDQNFDMQNGQLDGDALDELLRSTREELARLDALMGTGEDEAEQDADETKPQMPVFEPELPEEYADLTADTDIGEEEAEEPPRQRLSAGVKVLLYVCCVLAASVLLAVGAWKCADDVLALTKLDRTVTFTVSEGESIASVAGRLKEEGLVEYEWLFKFYCWFSHAERKIEPGTYELNNLYDYHALVNGMIATSTDRATVTVTVPEGYECKDIFQLLAENGVCTVDELEQTAANYQFDYAFLRGLEYGSKTRLEGYLFPDTYEFYVNDKPENVIDKFLRNFDNKLTDQMYEDVAALNDRLREKMQASGFTDTEIANAELTMHDVIIVASLVEKETAKTSESATIASVIYNRLCSKLYPCLQIDATIQYALGERKEVLSDADKYVISPYNTYTNAGLPAGPIANPGINSIRAALYPADTDYYFYALGTNGVHHFSTTYYEHQDFLAEMENN
ncbi:MAG: endolytic transglycosylase MltG [Clostridiales bacterium]|nr:endolytic transglycosylase MltG [Clostridiales bacterium]